MPWMLYKEIGIQPLAEALRGIPGTCIALQRNPAPGELDVARADVWRVAEQRLLDRRVVLHQELRGRPLG